MVALGNEQVLPRLAAGNRQEQGAVRGVKNFAVGRGCRTDEVGLDAGGVPAIRLHRRVIQRCVVGSPDDVTIDGIQAVVVTAGGVKVVDI